MDGYTALVIALTGLIASIPPVLAALAACWASWRNHATLSRVEGTLNGHIAQLVAEAREQGRLAGIIEERERAAGTESGILRRGPPPSPPADPPHPPWVGE